MHQDIPKGYEGDLGEYTGAFSEYGIYYSYGHKILRHLGDDRFNALRKYGSLEHAGDFFSGIWYLITKTITNEEAVKLATEKYGEVTKVEVGPKGGYRCTTYGDTTFFDRIFDPGIPKDDPRVEWEPPTPAMLALAKKRKLKKQRLERAKLKKASKK